MSKEENVRDTLLDVMGYSLIGIAILDGAWNDEEIGISSTEYKDKVLFGNFLPLFNSKLEAYGTSDIASIGQITQRIIEKIKRVENLTKNGTSPKILVKKVVPNHNGFHGPKLPGDVGYDIACFEDFELPPHGSASAAFVIPAGVHIKTPQGYFCQIMGRSSASKRGIGVQTAVIDNGYTGPLFACCWNMTDKPIAVKKGERIAQVVFFPSSIFDVEYVEELPETERGDKGFGSTGHV